MEILLNDTVKTPEPVAPYIGVDIQLLVTKLTVYARSFPQLSFIVMLVGAALAPKVAVCDINGGLAIAVDTTQAKVAVTEQLEAIGPVV